MDNFRCKLQTAPAHAHYNAFAGAEPACKDLGRNGQKRAITPKAAYTPVSNRTGSRSQTQKEE